MSLLKKIGLFACLFVVTSFAVLAQNEDEEEVSKLPNVKISNLDGDDIDIASYGDNKKITVISFWATWCAPCKKELNSIAELYDQWQEDYCLEVLAVSTDDTRSSDKVQAYVDGVGWEYDVLLDANEDLKRALNIQLVPYTVVVDAEGDIIYEHSGYVKGDEYELEEIIKEIYDETGSECDE